MQEKTYILKIVLTTFFINMFFVFAAQTSFAIFELPKNETGYHIDTSIENKVKVCKDVTCANEIPGTIVFPTPGIIDFNVSGTPPLSIDNEKGITGKVWGDELGWVSFNPPYGGVFFADTTTGLLKGTAWSETSGVINFSATGQQVVINPKTGEWDGWAWASGPYGGWIKFDCKNKTSCVHSTWRGEIKKEIPSSSTVKVEKIKKERPSYINDACNFILSSLVNTGTSLFEKISEIKINASAFTTSANNLKHFWNKITNIKIKLNLNIKVNDSAFTTSINNLKHFWNKIISIKINNSAFATSANNLKRFGNEIGNTTYQVFEKTGKIIGNGYRNIGQTTIIVGNSVGKIIESGYKNITKTVIATGNFVGNFAHKNYQTIGQIMNKGYNSASQLTGNAYNAVSSSFGNITNLGASLFENTINKLLQ